eukprot:scaffold135302_cov69-Cyclotella_meneghiniana.AAC.1
MGPAHIDIAHAKCQPNDGRSSRSKPQTKISDALSYQKLNSLFANLYPPSSNPDKQDETITAAAAASSAGGGSARAEKTDEFASFLSSQEFDASAINGEDGDDCSMVLRDVNISGLSNEFQIETALTSTVDRNVAPVADSVMPTSCRVSSLSKDRVRKQLVAVPDIELNDTKNNNTSWWKMPTAMQTAWEQITASRCNCLSPTMMWTENTNTTNPTTYQNKVANEIAEYYKIADERSTSESFVIQDQVQQVVLLKSPLQRKVASTPVQTAVTTSEQQIRYRVVSPENNHKENSSITATPKTPLTQNALSFHEGSVSSCRSTPLIGEHLVSTPRHEEDKYNGIKSKTSSQLFGESVGKENISKECTHFVGEFVLDSQNAEEYSPPPSHLLPAMIPQKEMLFATNKYHDVKSSKTESSLDQSTKLLRRARDRRKQRIK